MAYGFGSLDKAYNKYPRSSGGGGGGFMKLEMGENPVRFLSQMAEIAKHWHTGSAQVCPGIDGGCATCRQAEEMDEGEERNKLVPSVRHLVHVWDFKDSTAKILEAPATVIGKLGDLYESKEWPFTEDGIPNFNFKIMKKKKGERKQDVEYEVVPSPNGSGTMPQELSDVAAKLDPIEKIRDNIVNKALGKSEASGPATTAPAKPAPADGEEEINVEDIPF